MQTTKYFLQTLRENPSDAEVISHKLMLRSGMIRKSNTGIYTWLPLGLKVLRKVEKIVREKIDKSGALEILMPQIQSAELWKESGRWEDYGPNLLKIFDRHNREMCFGPTHEEVITDLVRFELKSYKQLPVTLYQIQTKFRDEIRPRFGVMRAREFVMKDAYSFHSDTNSLQETYDLMLRTYKNIFTSLGLKFRVTLADTGSIGGSISHEFHVLAETGEDEIAFSDTSDYAANVEIAEAKMPNLTQRAAPKATLEIVATPSKYSIDDVCCFLNLKAKQTLKTLLVKGKDKNTPLFALVLRGDHELNEIKIAKIPEIASPLTFASQEMVSEILGCHVGSLGPFGLKEKGIPVIADRDAILLSDFVCGANQNDKHYRNVNWERDLPLPRCEDIRKVVAGDLSPDGQGTLQITRGIEVGHIFQLGDKYSKAMRATVLDGAGKAIVLQMGCYGIGVSRIVAAAIEQNHDERGIVWPDTIAPFQVAILPMSLHKSYRVREASEKIYHALTEAGLEVLFDDRKERAGVIFADMELIGIPHLIIIGESGLDTGHVEYKNRRSGNKENIKIEDLITTIKAKLTGTT